MKSGLTSDEKKNVENHKIRIIIPQSEDSQDLHDSIYPSGNSVSKRVEANEIISSKKVSDSNLLDLPTCSGTSSAASPL